MARVIELGNRGQEALDDVELVKNGELDGDPREFLEVPERFWYVVAVFEVKKEDAVTVKTV